MLTPLYSLDYSGNFESSFQRFINDSSTNQHNQYSSVSGQLDLSHLSKDNQHLFTASPFFRFNASDNVYSHIDFRELSWIYIQENFEIRSGLLTQFWGVLEINNVVDILNQLDGLENLSSKEKLGQAMINVSFNSNYGLIDLIILPYFRNRQFSDSDSRFTYALPIDKSETTYESSANQSQVSVASRWANSLGYFDIGTTFYRGTYRNPFFNIASNSTGTFLVPHYALITQYGLDVQMTYEAWLLKFEAASQLFSTYTNNTLLGLGAEYTIYSPFDTTADIGLIAEYYYDKEAYSPFQNDIFLGTRVVLNDFNGTEFISGFIMDVESSSKNFRLEGARRINNNIKIGINSQFFITIDKDDSFYSFRNDDYLEVILSWYF